MTSIYIDFFPGSIAVDPFGLGPGCTSLQQGGIVRRVTSTRSTRTGARAATSAEAALRFANELAHACTGALGKTVAGVILHGSLTLGDYVPGRSDVDLLVVVDEPPATPGSAR
jgi:Nucleotidyltransferase domain